MGTTPNLGLPYPEPGDTARDAPLHIQQLAEAIDELRVCRISSSVYTQNFGDNVSAVVQFDTVDRDPGGWADVAGDRIVIGEPGWYHMAATITLGNNGAGYSSGAIKVDGATFGTDYRDMSTWRTTLNPRTTGPRWLGQGDVVQFEVAQNTAGAVTATASGPIELAVWRA